MRNDKSTVQSSEIYHIQSIQNVGYIAYGVVFFSADPNLLFQFPENFDDEVLQMLAVLLYLVVFLEG